MKTTYFPRATAALCAVLLLIFLLDVFVFVPDQVQIWSKTHLLEGDKAGYLTQSLKLVTSKVLKGELWRPLTSMFLHAGALHILFNTICLLNVGALVERQVGAGKTLILFVLSGLFSAVCMMLLTGIEDGLGASTAIFGLFGVWLVLLVRNRAALLACMRPVHWVLLATMLILGNVIDATTRLEHLTGTVGGVILGLFLV